MKKIITFLFIAFFALAASAQQSTQSSNVKNFINRVKTHVANEGYRPEIDDDGDISFKVEGITNWIRVREEEGGYYLVRYFHYVGCEDAEAVAVIMAVNQVNQEYKVGKCFYDSEEEEVCLKVEGFFSTANEFTKYFTRFTSILDNMDEDIKEYYSNFAEALEE